MAYDEKKNGYGVGMMIGLAIGVLTGLFMAPKSGKENRKTAAKKFKEFMDDMPTDDLRKRADDVLEDVQKRAKKLTGDVEEEVEERMKKR